MSLTRKVLRTHLSNNNVEHELRRIIDNLAVSAKFIAFEVRKSNRKTSNTTNMYGETQLELDTLSDYIIRERIGYETSFKIKEFASEEKDHIIEFHTDNGSYSITVDPLDGSSLVDVDLTVGTIFGIHYGNILNNKPGKESLVAAMYILYGPQTTLVYSAGKGTHEFVLNEVGSWVLSQENIELNEKGKIYSPGGLRKDWFREHKEFIEKLEEEGYKLRYSGSFVADANQILMKKGGIFTYPKLTNREEGKLRMLFELQPLAFIFENAGGCATNGLENILDITISELGQRSPAYIGSRYEVELAKLYLTNN
ncbi:MAG TPA: fructose-1,6-bisphosphatase [Bacteroidetes bacterium]|nr:fructose-1,6-bisphosphatase [Bacteroidota bacterium]